MVGCFKIVRGPNHLPLRSHQSENPENLKTKETF